MSVRRPVRPANTGGPSKKPLFVFQQPASSTVDCARVKNNGPLEFPLAAFVGISVLLHTTPAADPQWQSNQAEHQGRTHEYALLQAHQRSGLLHAQSVTAA